MMREKEEVPMRRYAQIISLRAEDEAEYVRYHAEVWPTVL
jgi:L-rhamnose mutarotase